MLLAAVVTSALLGIRSGRRLRGTRESAVLGIVYGNMWWLGSLAIAAIGQALSRAGMAGELLAIFYPSAFIFYAGVMYVMSGLIWHAYPMIVLGVWSVIVSAVGAFVPQPAHYLLYALAGGGAFLLVAAWSAWWVRAARRRAARPLEDAECIVVNKTHRGRTPVTYLALTRKGRRAFEDYTAQLRDLLGGTS